MKVRKSLFSMGGIAMVAVLALMLFSSGGPVFAQQTNPTATPSIIANPIISTQLGSGTLADLQNQLTALYSQVSGSVVTVNILGTPSAQSGFFQQQPQGQQGEVVPVGAGSGVVWDNQGHIVTNNHVVENAQEILVNFADGTSAQATVVGTDPNSDLAVISVNLPASQLHPIATGSMDSVKVGDIAIALGNPYGLGDTMTMGIISALGRSLPVGSGQTAFTIPSIIQTDAPINPGNSGGALVNINGELIGIPSAIVSSSGSGSGVGFAIPVSLIKRVVPALIQNGQFQTPFIGISGTTLTPAIAKQMGLPISQNGALVVDVVPGGPAAQAGLQGGSQTVTVNGQQVAVGGDVITAIDGNNIKSMEDLITYLTLHTNVGDTVNLTVMRNGQSMQVPATLSARPSVPQTGQATSTAVPVQPVPSSTVPVPSNFQLGVQVAEVTPEIAQQYNLPSGTQGLLVGAIIPGYPGAQAGLLPGDVITGFNGAQVNTIQDLRDQLNQVHPGAATMAILRNGQSQQLIVNFGQTSQTPQVTSTPQFTSTPQILVPTATAAPSATNTFVPFATNTNTPFPTATSTPQAQAGAGIQTLNSLLGFNAVMVDSYNAAQSLNLPGNVRGIYVSSVQPGSIAAQSHLQSGDIITAINGQLIYSTQDLLQVLLTSIQGQPLTLTVIRDGNTIAVPLNLTL